MIQLVYAKVAGLMCVIMIAEMMEAFLKDLIHQLNVAVFSSFAHKKGKMLLSFTAIGSTQNQKLPVKLKLHLNTHIQRLVVRKKYGITYNGKLLQGTLLFLRLFLNFRFGFNLSKIVFQSGCFS